MNYIEEAIRAIEAQQAKVQTRSAAWMVGEQLKDICRREARSAELIAQDLRAAEMSITAAEKQIKAFADKHKTGNFACVTPAEADGILRKFYGLPEPEAAMLAAAPAAPVSPPAKKGGMVDLLDFL